MGNTLCSYRYIIITFCLYHTKYHGANVTSATNTIVWWWAVFTNTKIISTKNRYYRYGSKSI